MAAPMGWRLHTGGRFRTWLGARFGGDLALGDRIWRRILHGLGAVALVYYVLPNDFFLIAPKLEVLLAALAVVLVLEALRHTAGLELPTIRDYEREWVGSFAVFATAIVVVILIFPEPIAAAVVLGTALVDPLAGELRRRQGSRAVELGVPFLAYSALAWAGLAAFGRWPLVESAGLAVLAGAIAVAVERPKVWWFDDDLAMTLVPAVALYLAGVVGLGLPA
jgi:dolichol kinase